MTSTETERFKLVGNHGLPVMAQISHPETGASIDVEIIDSESHHGEYVQVQATDDGIDLRDESGEPPWMDASEVSDE